jgi:hypothetical protein
MSNKKNYDDDDELVDFEEEETDQSKDNANGGKGKDVKK